MQQGIAPLENHRYGCRLPHPSPAKWIHPCLSPNYKSSINNHQSTINNKKKPSPPQRMPVRRIYFTSNIRKKGRKGFPHHNFHLPIYTLQLPFIIRWSSAALSSSKGSPVRCAELVEAFFGAYRDPPYNHHSTLPLAQHSVRVFSNAVPDGFIPEGRKWGEPEGGPFVPFVDHILFCKSSLWSTIFHLTESARSYLCPSCSTLSCSMPG